MTLRLGKARLSSPPTLSFEVAFGETGGRARSNHSAGALLFEALGGEADELVVFSGIADLDGIAADLAIFDVNLARNGEIQDHGDFFTTVRAHESVFHRRKDTIPREILHARCSLGMNILIGCSLYFDLEGSVGGFVAVGHVAVGATALSRLQRRGGIVELTLRDQHVDLGDPVGSVKSESDAVGYVSGLPIGHDHGQVLLELSNAGVGRGA